MRKVYMSILLIISTFAHILAVPNEANIKMSPEGDHCFTESNTAKVTWSKTFKEEFNAQWPWPTTWTAINGLGPSGNSSIHVTGLDVQPIIDAATGEYTINFPKPGVYKVNVTIWYKADRTTLPLYANESFTKTFNIAFYKVTKFEPKKEKKVIKIGTQLTREDFNIETKPEAGSSLLTWLSDSTDTAGHLKAYLKLGDKICAETEFISVSVEFNYVHRYHKASLIDDKVLFAATVVPSEAVDYIRYEYDNIFLYQVKGKNTEGTGKINFDVYCNTGGAKATVKALIKESGVECDSISLTTVSLVENFDSTIINGESKELKFSTIPADVGTMKRDLTSSKENVGTISSDGKTFTSKGSYGVFAGIADRKQNESIIGGKITVSVDSQKLEWDIDPFKIIVTNAPPKFVERVLPPKVEFNTDTFSTIGGYVVYEDIDDDIEHYNLSTIANTENDGAIKTAITTAIPLEKVKVSEKEIKFPVNFATNEGQKIYRVSHEFSITLSVNLVVGISGTTNIRFEVPISEKSRFTVEALIVAMGVNTMLLADTEVGKDLKRKLQDAVAGLTGMDQFVVKFKPKLSFFAGGNELKIDDSVTGLPFESKTVTSNSQKIIISLGGTEKQF